MNKQELKNRADRLRRELSHVASKSKDAAALQEALADLLDAVAAGKIEDELEWFDVPGDLLFSEGELRQYPALESAYSSFKLYATGMEPPKGFKL